MTLSARLAAEGERFAVHCAVRDCGYRLGTIDPLTGPAGYFIPGSGPGAGAHVTKLKRIPRAIIGQRMPCEVACYRCGRATIVVLPNI